MNETIDVLFRHRSIRRFTADEVPDDALRTAVRAGQAASTSSAVQAYCAIRIRDPERRRRLVELTGGQEKVASCGAFLAICGDLRRHRLAAKLHGRPHELNLEAFLLAVIDATLFAQNLVIALESMGYGICYIGGLRNRPFELDELLQLPDGVLPLYGLCIGRAAESPAMRPRLPLEAVLFDERYPDDTTMLHHMAEYDRAYEAYLRDRGATPRGWSAIMATKFAAPERMDLADYYTSKGARFD